MRASGKIHPVQMYDAVAAVWLCVVLLWRLARPHVPGVVAQNALAAGGLGFFLLDMLRQPELGGSYALLEPSQWVALIAFATGWWWTSHRMFAAPNQRHIAAIQTPQETV